MGYFFRPMFVKNELYEDDELLIPREDIIQATDYYKTRKEANDKLLDKLTTYTKKYDVLETELDQKLELDIEKCLHAKKIAKADIKLYKDPFFMEIRRCAFFVYGFKSRINKWALRLEMVANICLIHEFSIQELFEELWCVVQMFLRVEPKV